MGREPALWISHLCIQAIPCIARVKRKCYTAYITESTRELKKNFMLRAKPEDLERWHVDARKRALTLSAWVRLCLDKGNLMIPLLEPGVQSPSPREGQPDIGGGRELPPEGSGRQEKEPDVPKGRLRELDSLSFEADRQRARELAQKEGKCTAYVAKGLRCRLCGKVH